MLASINDTDREMRINPLVRGPDGFEVDFDHLRQVIDSRTKILMLCSPHNPSGRVFSRQELETFGEIALEHDLIVLADEIHADVLFDGRQHVPFASLSDELARRTVTFSSATKSFNLAGLRAALAMFGTMELQERFHFLPARVLGGLSALNSAAAAMAWNDCEDWFEGTVQYLQSNRDYLTQRLSQDFPGIVYHPAQATFLSWLDCEQLDLPEPPFELLLAKARVALSDGRPFGPGGEQCVRLNFATSRQVLKEILDRMQAALY
jgi:cystathionine beta-lyase